MSPTVSQHSQNQRQNASEAAADVKAGPPLGEAEGIVAMVFERFTRGARRVLIVAQQEARSFGHNFIGTEHVLLGLLANPDGAAGQALASLGITSEQARTRIAAKGRAACSDPSTSPPFTPTTKRVLELSLKEATRLGHDHIGEGHLLLALLREGNGVAVQVMTGFGTNTDQIRDAVLARIDSPEPTDPTPGT